MAKDKGKQFVGPKSLCACGHTGDGEGSQHADRFQVGQGRCTMIGCDCEQFTWKQLTKKFEHFLERSKS